MRAAEDKLLSLQAGKEFPRNARYQKDALRKNILEGYQNNRIEVSLNGLSYNFIVFNVLIFHLYYIQFFLC